MQFLDQRLPLRFWIKVTPDPMGGCWLWIGATLPDGYGHFCVEPGRNAVAHRVSFEAENGPIADGLQIDHKCRVRCCVNPAHLEAVTKAENQRRGLCGELTTHCPAGHPYDDVNTYRQGNKRKCRKCNATTVRNYQARQRGEVLS